MKKSCIKVPIFSPYFLIKLSKLLFLVKTDKKWNFPYLAKRQKVRKHEFITFLQLYTPPCRIMAGF